MRAILMSVCFLMCAAVASAQYVRNPTPPKQEQCPNGVCPPGVYCDPNLPHPLPYAPYTAPTQDAAEEGHSLLPWRNHVDAELGAINRKLDSIQSQPIAPPAAQPTLPLPPPPAAEEKKEPTGNALEQKMDAFLKKLPIQGPITKENEKLLESTSWVKRLVGFDAEMLIQIALVVVAGLLIHGAYKKLHAAAPAIEAKLATIPGVGVGLAAGFEKLDTVNTGIDAKIQAATADLKSHLQSLQSQLTQVATAVPAPGQAPVVVTVPAGPIPAATPPK